MTIPATTDVPLRGLSFGILSDDISLQNHIRPDFRFCSFSAPLSPRKGLPAYVRTAENDRFCRRRHPGRLLRRFRSRDFSRFPTLTFSRKSTRFSAVRPSRGRNGGLVVLQRGRRCNAIRALRQPRGALIARPPQPDRLPTDLRLPVYAYE